MKMVALYYLATPIALLTGAGLAIALPAGRAAIFNPGAHGLSELVYAFTSAANSNGSAFAGLSGNTTFYNTALAVGSRRGRVFPGPDPSRFAADADDCPAMAAVRRRGWS